MAAVGCALPLRIVRIPLAEMAAPPLRDARGAESAGRAREALALYSEAVAIDPGCSDAWLGRLRLTPGTERAQLQEELFLWEAAAPAEALPSFLLGRLAEIEGGPASPAYQRAWERSGGDCAWLLDPRQMRPEGFQGWRRYLALLETLQPRSAELEFRTLWTAWELGTNQAVEPELSRRTLREDDRALLLAAFHAAEGQRSSALEAVSKSDGARPESLRLQVDLLVAQDRRMEAERILAGACGRFPDNRQWSALRARLHALAGADAEALQVISANLDEIVFPRERVGSALLLHDLRAKRGRDAMQELHSVVSWCSNPAELSALFSRFLGAGDVDDCHACLAASIELVPDDPNAESWRSDLATLERIGTRATILPEAWGFLRAASPASRRAAFVSIPEAKRAETLRVALAGGDAALRILALQLLRDGRLLAFAEVPSELARDGDPRVRGAWVAFAAAEGSEAARAAVASALEDPDPYVREIAARLQSQEDSRGN